MVEEVRLKIHPRVKQTRRKRICIVGAGAAGMAAAWSLGRFPEQFDVHVWERAPEAGGVATSVDVGPSATNPAERVVVNDGVQGGAPSYRNTLLLLKEIDTEVAQVDMKISFGKDGTAWNNYAPTRFAQSLESEIGRLGAVLRWIHRFEVLFIVVPIARVLKLFRFSDAFCYGMVFPLTALFFGTGNQTPNVSAAIFARVFLDPDLKLFDYDRKLLLSQTPRMFAFPPLGDIYRALVKTVQGATFCFNRPVAAVNRSRKGVAVTDTAGITEEFDEIVFACDAETVLKVVHKASWMERRVLGNVEYFNDITVTHEDLEYMERHYEIDLSRNDQYFVRVDAEEQSKIEMSFNLSNYQPHLGSSGRNIFQSIFLDDRDRQRWTIDDINPASVLLTKWWRQFAHTWRHFSGTVPFMRFLQGRRHSWFCGSYTLVNTHEVAVISGLAVADRLGAPYPFDKDPLARKQFDTYLFHIHGKVRS